MPFTDRQISALKPKPKRYENVEPGRTGLRIRVTPRGIKTWSYLYRFNGKQKRMVFGTYPVMGVAKAHSALADAREKLLAGIDPGAVVAEERAAERDAETVADLADEYIACNAEMVKAKDKKSETAAEDQRLLNRDILPHIGSHKARDVKRRDLILLLDKIKERGAPVMRNKAASLLSRLFDVGVDRGLVDNSPAIKISRLSENGRDRCLSMQEIHDLWHGLDDIDAIPAVRLSIKFLLATGQRRKEALWVPWSEIDFDAKLWTLPASRAKNKCENYIPLSPFVMNLIAEADKLRVKPAPARLNRKRPDGSAYSPAPSPYLFPSRIDGMKLEKTAPTRALSRNREKLGVAGADDPENRKTFGGAVLHDLRRSFSTWNSEIGNPPYIVEALLNHKLPGVAGVYNKAEYIPLRREAMDKWGRWLDFVTAGDFEAAREMQGADIIGIASLTSAA